MFQGSAIGLWSPGQLHRQAPVAQLHSPHAVFWDGVGRGTESQGSSERAGEGHGEPGVFREGRRVKLKLSRWGVRCTWASTIPGATGKVTAGRATTVGKKDSFQLPLSQEVAGDAEEREGKEQRGGPGVLGSTPYRHISTLGLHEAFIYLFVFYLGKKGKI